MQLGLELERELFLLSVVLGHGLGLLYDIFRVFRGRLCHMEDTHPLRYYLQRFLTVCTFHILHRPIWGYKRVCFSRYANRLCDRTSYRRKRCYIQDEEPFSIIRKLFTKRFRLWLNLLPKKNRRFQGLFCEKVQNFLSAEKNF